MPEFSFLILISMITILTQPARPQYYLNTGNCNYDSLLNRCGPQETPDFNLCTCIHCRDVCNPNYYLTDCANQQSVGKCLNFSNGGISQPEYQADDPLVRNQQNLPVQKNNAPEQKKKNYNSNLNEKISQHLGGEKQSDEKSSKTNPSFKKDSGQVDKSLSIKHPLISKSPAENITPVSNFTDPGKSMFYFLSMYKILATVGLEIYYNL